MHKYAYANANPVSMTDPSGNFGIAFGITVGSALTQIANSMSSPWGGLVIDVKEYLADIGVPTESRVDRIHKLGSQATQEPREFACNAADEDHVGLLVGQQVEVCTSGERPLVDGAGDVVEDTLNVGRRLFQRLQRTEKSLTDGLAVRVDELCLAATVMILRTPWEAWNNEDLFTGDDLNLTLGERLTMGSSWVANAAFSLAGMTRMGVKGVNFTAEEVAEFSRRSGASKVTGIYS